MTEQVGSLAFGGKKDTARADSSVEQSERTPCGQTELSSCNRSTAPSTNQLDRDTRKARKSIRESSMNRFKTSKFKNTTPKIAKKDVSNWLTTVWRERVLLADVSFCC